MALRLRVKTVLSERFRRAASRLRGRQRSSGGRNSGLVVRPARPRDLTRVARLFRQSFDESLKHIFGRPPGPGIIRQVFGLCLRAEPEAFFVAEEGNQVAGYVFAPSSLSRLWRTAVFRGFLARWTWAWLTGRYRIGWQPLKVLLLDKFMFLRSSVGGEHAVDARILSIAVGEPHRGRGIARALLDRGLDYLKRAGAAEVRLEVRPWNNPARRLYERAGFRTVDKTRDSLGEWLVMIKTLDNNPACG